jgi:hypothetical protein
MAKKTKTAVDPSQVNDVLNISGQLIPEIDPVLDSLLEQGKVNRVMILSGTETPSNAQRKPYAVTKVRIDFESESYLRRCVQLLRWSDERLRARPDQLILWDWQRTYRDGMTIHFGVSWYDKEFFEHRKDAFTEPGHTTYYAAFGASAKDFQMEHEILG